MTLRKNAAVRAARIGARQQNISHSGQLRRLIVDLIESAMIRARDAEDRKIPLTHEMKRKRKYLMPNQVRAILNNRANLNRKDLAMIYNVPIEQIEEIFAENDNQTTEGE